MGRSQPMKGPRPPKRSISSGPGLSSRWKVLPSTISYPSAATSSASSPLTVAFVASGTKAGVRTPPWAVWSVPARAREEGSRASMLNADTAAS